MGSPRRVAFPAIIFVSGAAALLFETLWFRLATLVFGSSAWAAAIVLASFMGGLALGNFVAVRLRPGSNPLRVYAALEAGIAVSGVALVLVLPTLSSLLVPLFRPLLGYAGLLNGARLVIAFCLLIVPATLMGSTLPIVVRSLSPGNAGYVSTLGQIYGWNLLGSMAGSLAGEVFLIQRLGMRGAGFVAGALDLFAAAAALTLSASFIGNRVERAEGRRCSRRAFALLAAAFTCGFVLLALEVLWFRFAQLFLFGSSLTFAVMLSVVLLGIGIGSLLASAIVSRWPSIEQWLTFFAACAAAALMASYWTFEPLAKRGPEFLIHRQTMAAVADSVRLMMPVSIVSGFLFTLLGTALNRELRDSLRSTALLTFANTSGAAIGSVAAGFLLIPRLGMESSFFILAAAYGVVVLLTARRGTVSMLAIAVVAGALIFFPSGLMRSRYLPLALQEFLDHDTRVEIVREGIIETAVYLRTGFAGQPYVERLFTNGFSMSATTFLCRRYMSVFARLPLALRPSTRSALLISYGVGVTARSLADSRQLASIDIVDISPDILALSRVVWPGATNPLLDPRVRVHIEDGRFFLLTSEQHFDLITGEPPPPKHAGIANLYSLEYFRLIRDRLSDGGIATYWLPIDQLTSSDTRSVIGAFCGAFDDCSLWNGAGNEWMLMGSRGGIQRPTAEEFSKSWSDLVEGPALRRIGFEAPEQLAATFLADADTLRAFAGPVAPLTDDRPLRLSSYPPRQSNEARQLRQNASQAFRSSRFVQGLLPVELLDRAPAAFATQAVVDQLLLDPAGHAPSFEILYGVLTSTDLRTLPRLLLRSDPWLEDAARKSRDHGDQSAEVLNVLAIGALCDRQYRSGQQLFEQAAGKGMAGASSNAIFAALLSGDVVAARAKIAADNEPLERWNALEELMRRSDISGDVSNPVPVNAVSSPTRRF